MASDTNYPHRTDTTLMPASDPFVEALDLGNRPVIDGDAGGMYGWAGNIFEYMSAQPHVSQQGWCIVLSTPAFFSRLPGGNKLHSLCKAFFENRSQEWSGIRDSTEINFGSMEWTGHKMSVATGATRSLGSVTHKAYDVEGEVFTHMLKTWSRWGVMDPEILNAKMVILDDPGDMLLDDTSYSAIYFEPTRNMKDVAHAAILVAGQPTTTVPIEIKRNKADENQIRSIEMEFTGVIEMDTLAVKQIARKMLQLLPLFNPDAVTAPAGFQERTSVLENLAAAGTIERMTMAKATVAAENGDYLG
jgi:hypothetical protein